jgi:hypothetical protein
LYLAFIFIVIFIMVDVVFWLTCEIWIQMYGDWNDTEWGYIVGSENYYIEMHMESFLANVEQTFYIKGRGLIVAPSFPVSEYKFDTQERIRVETPEGTELFCDAYFKIPFQNPRPKYYLFAVRC